jgi:CHAD domain-containing protein
MASRKIQLTPPPENGSPESYGLSKWLRRALKESEKARGNFKPRHIHDLRVALRRCRSVAMGLEQIDPSPAWPKMRKACKRLLEGMSDLRDIQVLHRWISRLGMSKTQAGLRLATALAEREHHARRQAKKKLNAFDSKQWRKWAHQLPKRARRIEPGSHAFQLITLDRLQEAWELHRRAMRSRSRTSYHHLRIGLKGIRYTVESFMPKLAASWGNDLKRLQDLLGDVHDLDVLWAALLKLRPSLKPTERRKWQKVIEFERGRRLATYRAKMTGPRARWSIWRGALPEGRALEQAQVEWLSVWASFLDPDPASSRRVTRLALQLFDGIQPLGFPVKLPERARELLEAAGIVRDVGRIEGDAGHQKSSFRLISRKTPPPGMNSEQIMIIARIARYHRGRLPVTLHDIWEGMPAGLQEGIVFLVAVLRLATAFGGQPKQPITRLKVLESANTLRIIAFGYLEEEPLASELASVRHLLENVLHRSISIQGSGAHESVAATAVRAAAAG